MTLQYKDARTQKAVRLLEKTKYGPTAQVRSRGKNKIITEMKVKLEGTQGKIDMLKYTRDRADKKRNSTPQNGTREIKRIRKK